MANDIQEPQGHFANEPSPGELLRAARNEKKLDTKEIAATLNVDPWMLDALEHDEYGALGAPVFAKGHLRKYATLLGLNADDLMIAYYQRAGTREAPPLVAESILRVESSHGPRLTWLAPVAGVVVLAAVIALGVFFYRQSDSGTQPTRAVTMPETTADNAGGRSTALRLPGAPAVPAAGPQEPAPEPPVTVPHEQSGADLPASVGAQTTAAAAAAPLPQARTPDPTPTTTAPIVADGQRVTAALTTVPDTRSVTVTLRFRGESWVEVYDRDRTKLLYGLGEAGTTRSLNGTAPLNVFLGKAGDVDVSVDGRDYRIPRVSSLGTARFDVDAPPR